MPLGEQTSKFNNQISDGVNRLGTLHIGTIMNINQKFVVENIVIMEDILIQCFLGESC